MIKIFSRVFIFLSFFSAYGQGVDLEWVKQLDVSNSNQSQDFLTVDVDKNVLTVGSFSDTVDFDPGADTLELIAVGSSDAYAMKQDVAGNLVWAYQWDVIGISAITTDASKNTYIIGTFAGTKDFDPGPGVHEITATLGFGDVAFILKLDADGNFAWVKQLESLSSSHLQTLVQTISVDNAQNIHMMGSFDGSIDFDPGVGNYVLISSAASTRDAFILKLDANGDFVWAKQLEGDDNIFPYSLAVGSTGNVYATGSYEGTIDFNPGAGDSSITAVSSDAYMLKLNSAGDFVWARSYGKTSVTSRSVKLDASENVYMAGSFQDSVDFDPGVAVVELKSEGSNDVFVSKLDADGNFIWANRLGGTSSNVGHSMGLGTDGGVYLSGSFSGTMDANPGLGDSSLVSLGGKDVFVTKLDATGNFEYARQYGGTGDDEAYSVFIDADKNVYTAGYFSGTADFDPSAETVNLISIGGDDFFVHKMSICPATYFTYDPTVCDSLVVPSGDEVYFVDGTYMDTIPNAAGCDSILTINLTVNKSSSETLHVNLCDSLSYTVPSGDETYTMNGTYMDTILNAVGCDSILTIHLTFNTSSTNTIVEVVCDSYTVPSGDETYTSSGVYMDTIPNAVGCDSVITINLTVNDSSSASIVEVACDSYTVPSGDETYTVSGMYKDTIPNAAGCDSILTIDLTINNSTSNTIDVSLCDEIDYTVPSGDETYFTSGTYMDTIPNAVGCDSVLTINLTLGFSSSKAIDTTVCGSYTSPSGKEFTVTGMYKDTIPNAAGCDSLFTIDLEVNYVSDTTLNVVACDSYTSPSGKFFTASGTYLDTIPNATACDSLVTINLTINNSSSASIDVTLCDETEYTVPSGDETYYTNGTIIDTIPNAAGCDSVMTIKLTFNFSSSSTINVTSCDSYTVPSGDEIYTADGTYMDTIPSTNGCDSVITINLTIKNSSVSSVDTAVCASYISPSGLLYTASGTYLDTIPNAIGCDSIVTINLTIKNTTTTLNVAQCYSYTSPSGKVYTTSGTYMDTIPNAVGCDSIITIDLIVYTATASTIQVTVCDSYTVPSGDETYTVSGTYMDTIPNAVGCDSVITITLVVNSSTSFSMDATACDAYTSPSGKIYTTSATYLDTIPNIVGCDSIITINLTINNSSTSTLDTIACSSYTTPSGGEVYTVSGSYMDTIPNALGCDSIMTIHLIIVDIDSDVELKDDTILELVNPVAGATYQWIDCKDGSTISGATGSTYVAKSKGNYAVIISVEQCTEVSVCVSVTNISPVGIDENVFTNNVEIFPNPNNGQFILELEGAIDIYQIEVVNTLGQVVKEHALLNNKRNYTMDYTDLQPGVYSLRLVGPKGVLQKNMVIR